MKTGRKTSQEKKNKFKQIVKNAFKPNKKNANRDQSQLIDDTTTNRSEFGLSTNNNEA